nr:aldose epimerase family protein [Fulvivirga sedimenti]
MVTEKLFGTLPTGEDILLYTLRNRNGLEVEIMNYGGIIVSIRTPDRHGKFDDIVLGFDDLQGYLGYHPFYGAIVGRFANRIRNATFHLDGNQYTLAANIPPHHLHGGNKGFDKVVWKCRTEQETDKARVILTYFSPDMEEGYPGNLDVEVIYSLTDSNELELSYSASTDKPTIINLTNHSYFNLKGAGEGTALDHILQINADEITNTDESLIPTGELIKVEGTPFDFRKPCRIGARIDADNILLKNGGGYDQNFVIRQSADSLTLAARVEEPHSGRVMEVFTTEPGMQLFTANFGDGITVGKGGRKYHARDAFCLETQHFPDAPNHPEFQSTVLRPGEQFSSKTVFSFSTFDK